MFWEFKKKKKSAAVYARRKIMIRHDFKQLNPDR